MQRRAIRLGLFVLMTASLAVAGVLLLETDGTLRTMRAEARAFDERVDTAVQAVEHAQRSLVATLAHGQDEAFHRRATLKSVDDARNVLAELAARVSNPDALNGLDAAAADLEAFVDTVNQADRLLAGDQRNQAALLVFSQGLERGQAATERLRATRAGHAAAVDGDVESARRAELYTAGGLAIGALIALGLLVPITRRDDGAPSAVEPSTIDRDTAVAGSLALDLDVPVAQTAEETAPPAPLPQEPLPVAAALAAPTAEGTLPEVAPRDRRKAPELRATADLCTDFARLLDSQELPALLERAAKLIDASGLVIWIADPDTAELRAALACGYPASALERMPAIPRSADNATAAAFRYAELQVVKTNGMSPGALVVPLLNSTGCIGVVAAEVRHGRESSESARALARIIAAQLSGVLSVPVAAEAGRDRHESADTSSPTRSAAG